jgi:hypothetical protein
MIRSANEFFQLSEENSPRAVGEAAVSEDVWFEVIRSYPTLKEWVIQNKTVPISVLRVLATDQDTRVRFSVAMKNKCNEEILEWLSRDPDETVRVRVAWNRKASPAILEKLANDASELVRSAVRERSSQRGS